MEKKCAYPECEIEAFATGLCRKHYKKKYYEANLKTCEACGAKVPELADGKKCNRCFGGQHRYVNDGRFIRAISRARRAV